MPRTGPNAANPSTKIAHDCHGRPWLIVATDDGYEAQRVLVVDRHLFDRSWQAVRFATEFDQPLPIAEVD
jgi:hypothetical protein